MSSQSELAFHAEKQVLASGALAEGANNSDDQTNDGYRGVQLVLDYTAESGTSPTLDVKVQVKDPVSGNYVDLAGAAFAQQNAVGTNMLTIYPGIAETANVTVSDGLAKTWRIVGTVGGSDTPTVTASVGATMLR